MWSPRWDGPWRGPRPEPAAWSAPARSRPARAAGSRGAVSPAAESAPLVAGTAGAAAARSLQRAQPGDLAPHDEGVDVVGALVGVDGLEVEHVADGLVAEGDAAGAQDLAGAAGGGQRRAHVVALGEADLRRAEGARVLQLAQAPR